MARTNLCKDCGSTEGPWVGTNHNLCASCADKRPRALPCDPMEPSGERPSARMPMLGLASLAALACAPFKEPK